MDAIILKKTVPQQRHFWYFEVLVLPKFIIYL